MFHIFDKVKVKIMLDSTNLQHQKIRMSLVEPQVRPNLHCLCCNRLYFVKDGYNHKLFPFNDRGTPGSSVEDRYYLSVPVFLLIALRRGILAT